MISYDIEQDDGFSGLGMLAQHHDNMTGEVFFRDVAGYHTQGGGAVFVIIVFNNVLLGKKFTP